MSLQRALSSRVLRNVLKRRVRFSFVQFGIIFCLLIILLVRPRFSFTEYGALSIRLGRSKVFIPRKAHKPLHRRRYPAEYPENTAGSALHMPEDWPYGFIAAPFKAPRKLMNGRKVELSVPKECFEWRLVARDTTKLKLYRRHFTSLDFIDWFIFVSMFTESWHAARHARRNRPVYLDVAANHARRWSNTYFLDRCLGWNGICAEANPSYHTELRAERPCALIDTCVSDVPRMVNFSFTGAWGGVVRDVAKGTVGVDASHHTQEKKYLRYFHGFHPLKCTTLGRELRKYQVKHVDFMSLDVEGYELPVLQGIDWKNTIIDVIVAENKRESTVQFIIEKGYQRYTGVLKDDIYIRDGTGYTVNENFAGWLENTKHLFH